MILKLSLILEEVIVKKIIQPNFTQIGSLPFDNISKAIAYSLDHDIPFLPELISLGDGMFEYIKNPGKLSCLKEFQKQKYDLVKIQCTGPVSLMGPPGYYSKDEAVERAYQHIDSIVQVLDAKEIILFLDEPSLPSSGVNFEDLWGPIFDCFDVVKGVHCCQLMQWDLLFKAGLDLISFDASQYDITKFYKKRDKRIAWGIQNKDNIKDFKPGDLITPPCGLGYKTEDECYQTLDLLKKVSSLYKNKKN